MIISDCVHADTSRVQERILDIDRARPYLLWEGAADGRKALQVSDEVSGREVGGGNSVFRR